MTHKQFRRLLREQYPGLSDVNVEELDAKVSDQLLGDGTKTREHRVQLAVRAWLRHTRTAYDSERRVVSFAFARQRCADAVRKLERRLLMPPVLQEIRDE